MLTMKHFLAVFAAAMLPLTLTGTALSQTQFPSKPIRIIPMGVGFPETTTRIVVNEMSTMVNQPIVVEAKPGANGILASEFVAKRPPDGYTILIGTNSTHAANQSLYKKLPYDYVKDFAPVSGVSQGMLMAVVNPSRVPAKSISELTALAKSNPGKLSFGYGGSSPRAAVELYKLIVGIQLIEVPYKTNPQAAADLIGGRIDLMISDFISLGPHVKAGTLRGLAVTGLQRAQSFPDLPTMQEAGVPDYSMTFWLAAYVPAGTPPDVVSRLNDLFVAAVKRPKVLEYLTNTGSVPFPTTPDELMKFQIAEEAKWRKIVVAAGIQPE